MSATIQTLLGQGWRTGHGILLGSGPSTGGVAVRSIFVAPSGSHVYAGSGNGPSYAILQYSQAAGVLTALSPASVTLSTNVASELVVSPDGGYLYASAGGFVFQFSIASGLLTPLSPAAVTVAGAQGIAISPDGNYLYVASNSGNVVHQFSIGVGTGLLTPLSPATVATGTSPWRVAVSPDGLNLYVTNFTANTVSQYSISSGLLTALSPASVATGTTPYGIVVHPDGTRVYIAHNGDGIVGQYSRSSGLLTRETSFDAATTAAAPRAVSVSPDGLHVYVVCANSGSNTVNQFAVVAGRLQLMTPGGVSSSVLGANGLAMVPTESFFFTAHGSTGNVVRRFARN